jgi:hypothetical protein
VLVAGLAAGLLTACGGTTSDPAGGDEAAGTSPAEQTSAPDLASGLLPAEAFGPQATVVAITLEQLKAGAGLAGSMQDLQVTPPSCLQAVQGTQPRFDEFPELAAETATTGTSTTVEVLMRGGPTEGAAETLTAAVQGCPQAEITSPQFGRATVAFQVVELTDAPGDAAAAVLYTTVVSQPNGTQLTVPGLIGLVEDGDRLVTLMTLAPGGAAPDTGSFTALLQQAYEAQAEALD